MIEKAALDFYREHLEGDFLKIYRPYLRGIKPEQEYLAETKELIRNFAQDLIQARMLGDRWQMRYMQLGEVVYRPASEEEVRDILAMAEALYTPLTVLEQMPEKIAKPESSVVLNEGRNVESLFLADPEGCLFKSGRVEMTPEEHHFRTGSGSEVKICLKVTGEPVEKAPVWGFGGYKEYPCEGYVVGYMTEVSHPMKAQCYEESQEICLMWEPKGEDLAAKAAFWKEYSSWESEHAGKLEDGFRDKIRELQTAVDGRTFVKKNR